MLGDGLKYEYGPYCAALDARIDISADAKLSVKYALDGRVGPYGGRGRSPARRAGGWTARSLIRS